MVPARLLLFIAPDRLAVLAPHARHAEPDGHSAIAIAPWLLLYVGSHGRGMEGPQPRATFLTDPYTSRDIFGVVRGRCTQCSDCGRYLKATAEYTLSASSQVGRRLRPVGASVAAGHLQLCALSSMLRLVRNFTT